MPGPEVLAAVGRLGPDHAGSSGCTAALVGERRIVTAGHCVGPQGPQGRAGALFVTGIGEPEGARRDRTARFQRLPRAVGSPAWWRDLAVMDLAQAPPDTMPLAMAPPPPMGARVVVASYPDRPGAIARSVTACPVTAQSGRGITLGCPAVSGMSGAPVLVQVGREWRVAGVMVARLGALQSLAVVFDPTEFDPPAAD